MNRLVISTLALLISFNSFSSSDEDIRFLKLLIQSGKDQSMKIPYASYMGDKSSNQDWPDLSEKTLKN
ncbi:MAG: hypothetical protein Ct9H90mP13_04260 [Pseudomonadota bacterium]|nr:MAG: hypothetical protein Ct9H90mP13_04260 [Pseudomonadota bacterium]